MPNETLMCIAHRGVHDKAPENSLSAFTRAVELGTDGIELDVWNINDQLLIYHDRRLGALLPGSGRLIDQSASHLLNLQLPNGASICTLDQVLDQVGSKVLINIELKGPGCHAPVAQLLRRYRDQHELNLDSCLISSFDHRQLWEFKQRLPEVKTGALIASIPLDYAALAEPINAYSIHPNINAVDQRLVDDAHTRGLKVFVYTVNHEDDFEWLSDLGVDGVFTDNAQLLLNWNQKRGVDKHIKFDPW